MTFIFREFRRTITKLFVDMPKRVLVGTVEKVISPETVTVTVVKVKAHTLYKKIIRLSVKYMAHVLPNQKVEVGQKVEIEECKPISKTKKWILKTV